MTQKPKPKRRLVLFSTTAGGVVFVCCLCLGLGFLYNLTPSGRAAGTQRAQESAPSSRGETTTTGATLLTPRPSDTAQPSATARSSGTPRPPTDTPELKPPTDTAAPDPRVETAGLGISRAEVQGVFEELGFAFEVGDRALTRCD